MKRNKTALLNSVLGAWDTDKQVTLTKKLNTTSFKSTWEGTWNDSTKVIIKVHQPGTSASSFLQDAMVMVYLRHPNILQLLAVYREKRPFLIVCELVQPENLLDYLRSGSQSLEQPQLFTMCHQIASGMAYMESQKYIHCDLAARNVWLTDNLTCKVANFSLADTISDEEIYTVSTGTEHSIMWSPPEVLVENRYTRKSDIWSFGIVLYEVITCGQAPYFGLTNPEVILKVKQGYRMPQPSTCPDNLYGMMRKCWQGEPESRPTFQTLLTHLKYLSADSSNSTSQNSGCSHRQEKVRGS